MEENKKFKLVSSKKTRYLLPNILTLGGVCLGISSIKFSIDGNYSLAVIFILLAAILIPMPDPQIAIPRSTFLSLTNSPKIFP